MDDEDKRLSFIFNEIVINDENTFMANKKTEEGFCFLFSVNRIYNVISTRVMDSRNHRIFDFTQWYNSEYDGTLTLSRTAEEYIEKKATVDDVYLMTLMLSCYVDENTGKKIPEDFLDYVYGFIVKLCQGGKICIQGTKLCQESKVCIKEIDFILNKKKI